MKKEDTVRKTLGKHNFYLILKVSFIKQSLKIDSEKTLFP